MERLGIHWERWREEDRGREGVDTKLTENNIIMLGHRQISTTELERASFSSSPPVLLFLLPPPPPPLLTLFSISLIMQPYKASKQVSAGYMCDFNCAIAATLTKLPLETSCSVLAFLFDNKRILLGATKKGQGVKSLSIFSKVIQQRQKKLVSYYSQSFILCCQKNPTPFSAKYFTPLHHSDDTLQQHRILEAKLHEDQHISVTSFCHVHSRDSDTTQNKRIAAAVILG